MGGISNAISGDEATNVARNDMEAMEGFRRITPPSIAQMKIKLAELVQQGVLTPEMAQTFLQEASAYEQMDPATREAQMGALADLQEVVSTDGMDPQAKAALYELQGATQGEERGQREAIMQNAAARGISGSGVELAGSLANQQGSASRLANQGFQSAADANARKMQAIQGVGQLGGQVWGQDAQKAAAQNSINQFNAANRQSVENQNTGWRNDAAAQNLAEKQRIADQNTGTKNQQELYNKGLYQQNFANQMGWAQGNANAALGAAQSELGLAKHKTQDINNTTAKWSDENLKTDIEDFDSSKFLDSITGYKYKFKDEKHGKGDQVGVMAQDLEKSGASDAVENHREGKKIDYSKLGGPVLASLASLNKRINELEGKD
jgi:hypothetical protein